MDAIRIGKISTIDYAGGTASVVFTDRNDEPSPNFPFFSFAYEMPKVDDTVVVILLSNSSTKGFIIGVPWSRTKIPSESGQGLFYKEFSDGAYVKYDAKTKTMNVSADEIVLQSVSAESVTVSGTVEAEKVIAKSVKAGALKADTVTVAESAEFKELTVSGTATIQNLTVSGTATGHYPS